jgi:hypothetical protein
VLKIEFALCGFVQITRGLRAGHLSRQAEDESAWDGMTPDGLGIKAIRQITFFSFSDSGHDIMTFYTLEDL